MINKLDKETIYQYYIIDLHGTEDCLNYFQCTRWQFQQALKKYEIKKTPEQIKKTKEKSFLSKYGTSNPFQLEEIKRKREETCLTRYGRKNPAGTLQSQEKKKKTCFEKYGVDSFSKTLNWKEKTERTCLKKYGVKSANQSKEKKEKTKKTVQEKYGVDYISQASFVPEKTKQTKKERYGDPCYNNSQKIRETCISLYGENYGKKIIEKSRETCRQKYGTPFAWQKNILHYDIWSDPQKFENFLVNLEEKPCLYELASFFNVDDGAVSQKISKYGLDKYINSVIKRSHYEDEIVSFLKQEGVLNVEIGNREILEGKEIDIYLPDYKMGIEFNGDYWHSDIFEKDDFSKGSVFYHQNKSLLAEKKGITLFHIFEYEWKKEGKKQKIKDFLLKQIFRKKEQIFPNLYTIKEISKKETEEFLKENYLFEECEGEINLGLFINNELLYCMIFNKDCEDRSWELSGFCSKKGFNNEEAFILLFEYFKKEKWGEKEKVFSCDNLSKTQERIYSLLNFKPEKLIPPDYVLINFSSRDIIKSEKKEDFKEGYHRVYDCGKRIWLFEGEEGVYGLY